MKPRYIYIASPYTIGDPVENVRRSLLFAEKVIAWGDVPICPLLCHLWHLVSPKPYQYWVDYSLKLLYRCDQLVRLPGESKGADEEVRIALSMGIPVSYFTGD